MNTLYSTVSAKLKQMRCEALCKGEMPHSHFCPIGNDAINQAVNTRQVRRYYARVMAKREKAKK